MDSLVFISVPFYLNDYLKRDQNQTKNISNSKTFRRRNDDFNNQAYKEINDSFTYSFPVTLLRLLTDVKRFSTSWPIKSQHKVPASEYEEIYTVSKRSLFHPCYWESTPERTLTDTGDAEGRCYGYSVWFFTSWRVGLTCEEKQKLGSCYSVIVYSRNAGEDQIFYLRCLCVCVCVLYFSLDFDFQGAGPERLCYKRKLLYVYSSAKKIQTDWYCYEIVQIILHICFMYYCEC